MAWRSCSRAAFVSTAGPRRCPSRTRGLAGGRPDVMVVAAYGLILPPWALALPRLGCLNIHASLLPRWRGAAPIQRAIEAGDARTGITIMQMDAGLDTGDMLLVEAVAIAPGDTASTLQDKLAVIGARLIVEALRLAAEGCLSRTRQPSEGVTYAHKIAKAEGAIDWSAPAASDRAQAARIRPVSRRDEPARRARRSRCGAVRWSRAAVHRARFSRPATRASSSPAANRHCASPNCSTRASGVCKHRSSSPPTPSRRICALAARVELSHCGSIYRAAPGGATT